MRPRNRGERVHLEDLLAGDTIDCWHRRSGGVFLKEALVVMSINSDGSAVLSDGSVMRRNTGWGEMRLINRE